jgi:hypothetical protein
MYGLETDDAIRSLLPYVTERSDRWAARWTLVISEVTRRSEIMGPENAVASVRDDLEAGRL